MRNDDLSQNSGTPTANDDYDVIPAGSGNSASGNTITGRGTVSGAAGADDGSGAHVTSITGAGGTGSSMEAAGRYGSVKIDAQGNYTYMKTKGGPDNVEDVFTYTLADKAGAIDSARLIIRIDGKEEVAKVQDGAQRIVAGNEVITLPAGVQLSDIHVVGRDLVINLPDGTQMVIVDGAVFVPQLALGDVEVPSDTLAQLLIDSEPRPAAGPPESSGGNFGEPVAPLDPGVPLGDLLPPTELDYTPPEFEEVYIPEDEDEPDLPPINAAPVTLEVDDDALPTGTNNGSTDEQDSATLTFTAGSDALTGFAFSTDLTGLGGGLTWTRISDTVIEGRDGGVLIVTLELSAPASIPGGNSGGVTVTMTLADNYDSHPGINADDLQSLGSIIVIASENDGTTATGVVNVGVSDDVPNATGATAASGITIDETTAGSPAGFPIEMTSEDPMISGTGVFGADGPAAVGSTVFGLALSNGGSTLATTLRTADGDQLITLQLSGDGKVITGTYGEGATAFTLTMNVDGTVTYKQWVPMEHSDDGNTPTDYNDTDSPITFSGLINATVTLKDGDNDTSSKSVPIGDLIKIYDDGPDAAAAVRPQFSPAILDETRAEGTDTDDGTSPGGLASTTIDLSTFFIAADFGADGAGPVNGGVSYSLVLNGSDVPSGLYALDDSDTSTDDEDGYGQGAEIVLNQDGNVITGSVGETDYFTITIDPLTGVATFAQINPIWHDTPGDFDELAMLMTENANDLVVRQTVTDADGDFDTADANIGQGVFGIQDDGPDAYEPCPDPVIAVNDPDALPTTGSLNLPDVGEDQDGTVTFGVVDNDPVLDTLGNPVTSGEDPLYYFINDEGVLEARVGGATGEVIFTITLNGDGTYTYDQVGQLGLGGTYSFDNFDEADAGNTNYVGLGVDDPATSVDLLMSAGKNTDVDPAIEDTTVNTSDSTIGAQNQSMDSDDSEVLRIDFVSNLQSGGSGATGFTFDGHVATTSFLQLVPQVQGSQDEVAEFKVWALNSTLTDADAPDRDPSDGFSDSTTVTITEVTIVDFETGETYVEDISGLADGATEALSFGVSVTRNSDGSVTFSGVQQGDQYGVSTGTGEFNAVAVQATDNSFDLGIFSIGIANEFEPVDIAIPVVVTDADGDSVDCHIDLHIGEPVDANGISVTVNEAGLDLVGSDPLSDSETQSGNLNTAVSGGTGPYSFAFAAGTSGDGAYGTLVIDPMTGEFTYTLDTPFDSQPDANDGTNPEFGADTFQIVVTDSLGASQTLTVNITIIDDVPTADFTLGEGAALIIDETDNFAANANETDGPGGNLGVATVTAAVLFDNSSIYGADGAAPVEGSVYSFALSSGAAAGSSLATTLTTSDGDDLITLYVMADGSVVGSTAGSYATVDTDNIVFSLSITDAGTVTMTQFQAIEHDQFPDNYNEASTVGSIPVNGLQVVLTVTDGDGDMDTDTVDLGSVIQFLDDGPGASVAFAGLPTGSALTELALTTSDNGTEGTGGLNAGFTQDSTTANFGDLFSLNADGGSDGVASSDLTFTLDVIGDVGSGGVDSGLDSHGATIYLYQMDDLTVYGSTSATKPLSLDGNVVFTLTTTIGGVVTLTQYQQIDHAVEASPVPGTGAPFNDQVASLGSNLVNLVASGEVTDNDGDIATDSESLDLGGLVNFLDDGPVIQASLVQGAALHIDESDPGVDNAAIETNDPGLGQVTVAISSVVSFTETVPSADQPTLATGYALNLGPVGSDGLVNSGLFHSVPGSPDQPIYLFKVGGVVYGTTSTSAPVGVDASTVFTVALSGGNIVMTQYQAVVNPTAGDGSGGSHDENSGPIANGALLLTVTATDYDGDTATSSVNLGSIVSFGDDGPVVTNLNLGAQPENANVIVDITSAIDAGSDGFDRVDNWSTDGSGTLSYDAATQQFTYDPSDGESGTVTITYRVYDNDGDWDDATISFSLAADSKPTVTAIDLTVDEQGLPNGTGELNLPALGSDQSEVSATQQLSISTGSDTLAKVEIQASNDTWIDVTGATVGSPITVTGTHGTLTVTSTGGVYSYFYTLTSNYATHPDNNPGDGDGIEGVSDPLAGDSFAVRVTDNESDQSTSTPADAGTINVTVLDDAPVADIALKAGIFIGIDESDSASDVATYETDAPGGNLGVATVTAATLFTDTSVYGADGAAALNSAVYSLQVNGVSTAGSSMATTLITSNGDLPITLYKLADGSIIGSTAATYANAIADSTKTVFSVSITASGQVTMTQFQAVEHTDKPNNFDETATQGSIPDAGIQVVLTVKDGDGDTSSDFVNLGSRIQFADDGPFAAISVTGVGVVHDETAGLDGDANDVNAFAFTVDNPGVDPHGSAPLGYARGTGAISSSGSSIGSDSAGTIVVSISAATNGIDSGVTTTDGTKIWLFNETVDGKTIIVGRVGATVEAADDGVAAFAIRLDATNHVEMVQFLSVKNPTGGSSYDEAAYLANNVIKATVTVTDSDGDVQKAEAFLANQSVAFQDDGLSVSAVVRTAGAVTLDETATTDLASTITLGTYVKGDDPDVANSGVTSGAIAKTVGAGSIVTPTAIYGVDGPAASGSINYALNILGAASGLKVSDGTALGTSITLMMDGNVIVGVVDSGTFANKAAFAISIDPTTGAITVEQYLSLQHPDTGNSDDSVNMLAGHVGVTVTVKDGDNDTAQTLAPIDISTQIKFEDDGPTLKAGTVTGAVGEDTLLGGNPDAGDGKTTSSGVLSLASLVDFGADGAGSVKFDASTLAALTAQNLASGGTALKYHVSADGLVLTAYTGASVGIGNVFTLTLSGTSATFQLLDQIDHLGANLTGTGDDQVKTIDFSGVIRAYDGDGDSVALGANSFKVDVEDDIPTTFTATATNFVNSGTFDNLSAPVSLNTANAQGADRPVSYTFVDDNLANNYLYASNGTTLIKSGGQNIVLSGYGTDTLVGVKETAGTTVFTMHLNADGTYTVDFDQKLDDGSGTSLTNLGFATAGNKNFNYIDVAGTTEDLLFGGYVRSADGTKTIGTVNTNNAAIGVNNQSMNTGDNLIIDFVKSPSVTGSASNEYDYAIPALPAEAHYQVNSFSFTIVQVGGSTPTDGVEVWVRAYNGDDNSGAGNNQAHLDELTDDPQVAITGIQVNGVNLNLASLTSDGNGGYLITGLDLNDVVTVIRSAGYDRLEIENAVNTTGDPAFDYLNDDSFDIGKFFFTKVNEGAPLQMQFDVAITDKDNDTVVSTNAITLNSTPAAPPVILDTNQDGFAFLGMDAGVFYDMDNDGDLDATAWAGAGDSILFRDGDGDGTVSNSTEFVFGGGGLTDLEALHAMYGDQLDSSDADFAMFGLWNDANSNGIVDGGEVQSLIDAGVTSIDLVSDGADSVTADGSVAIAGFASYTDADGEHDGAVADVAFAYADADTELEARFAGAANSTGVVAAALAAAGLASQAAARADSDADDGLATAAESGASVAADAPAAGADQSIEPQVAALIDLHDVDLSAISSSTFRNAVVEEDSNILIQLPENGGDEAADASSAANDTPVPQVMPVADVAPLTFVGEAIAPEGAGIQHNAVVSAELLEQPEAAIDQLLAKLGGDEAIESLVQVQGGAKAVQGWDMADLGHLPAAAFEHIGAQASLLHPDAVQPVVHG